MEEEENKEEILTPPPHTPGRFGELSGEQDGGGEYAQSNAGGEDEEREQTPPRPESRRNGSRGSQLRNNSEGSKRSIERNLNEQEFSDKFERKTNNSIQKNRVNIEAEAIDAQDSSNDNNTPQNESTDDDLRHRILTTPYKPSRTEYIQSFMHSVRIWREQLLENFFEQHSQLIENTFNGYDFSLNNQISAYDYLPLLQKILAGKLQLMESEGSDAPPEDLLSEKNAQIRIASLVEHYLREERRMKNAEMGKAFLELSDVKKVLQFYLNSNANIYLKVCGERDGSVIVPQGDVSAPLNSNDSEIVNSKLYKSLFKTLQSYEKQLQETTDIVEKKVLEKTIEDLERQLENLRKRTEVISGIQGTQQPPQGGFDRREKKSYSVQVTPKIVMGADNNASNEDKAREQRLRDIFEFYCRQVIQRPKAKTFEQLESLEFNLNINNFTVFARDFGILDRDRDITQKKIIEIYNKALIEFNDRKRNCILFEEFVELVDDFALIYYLNDASLTNNDDKRLAFYNFLGITSNKYKEKMVGAALPFNSRGEERIESKDYKVKIIAHSEKSREEIFEELEKRKEQREQRQNDIKEKARYNRKEDARPVIAKSLSLEQVLAPRDARKNKHEDRVLFSWNDVQQKGAYTKNQIDTFDPKSLLDLGVDDALDDDIFLKEFKLENNAQTQKAAPAAAAAPQIKGPNRPYSLSHHSHDSVQEREERPNRAAFSVENLLYPPQIASARGPAPPPPIQASLNRYNSIDPNNEQNNSPRKIGLPNSNRQSDEVRSVPEKQFWQENKHYKPAFVKASENQAPRVNISVHYNPPLEMPQQYAPDPRFINGPGVPANNAQRYPSTGRTAVKDKLLSDLSPIKPKQQEIVSKMYNRINQVGQLENQEQEKMANRYIKLQNNY